MGAKIERGTEPTIDETLSPSNTMWPWPRPSWSIQSFGHTSPTKTDWPTHYGATSLAISTNCTLWMWHTHISNRPVKQKQRVALSRKKNNLEIVMKLADGCKMRDKPTQIDEQIFNTDRGNRQTIASEKRLSSDGQSLGTTYTVIVLGHYLASETHAII